MTDELRPPFLKVLTRLKYFSDEQVVLGEGLVMPKVIVERFMKGANPELVWKIARNLTEYPRFMDDVESVQPYHSGDGSNCTAWTVLFNGNELRWIEIDTYNEDIRLMTFQQIEGDLADWSGSIEVLECQGGALTRYQVEFDFGIPALASTLHPLGERAIRANCNKMLGDIEVRSKRPEK